MSYLAQSHEGRADRLAFAEARWQAVARSRPDLEPALGLQRQLLGLVIDLAEQVEHSPLPRLTLPARYLAAKLARGVPALAGEPIPLPVPMLRAALLQLCDALGSGGAGEAAAHIRGSLDTGRLDAGSLLAASIGRDQTTIRVGALQRGLAPDLVWLVAELATSPYVHALQRALLGVDDPILAPALNTWTPGYCPACGSWPALAEVESGRRTLRCSFCAAAWVPDIDTCIYCGNASEQFVVIAPDEQRSDRRLERCAACRAYLKTIDVPRLSPFPLLAIGDLETLDLDIAAMQAGYTRPAMKELVKR